MAKKTTPLKSALIVAALYGTNKYLKEKTGRNLMQQAWYLMTRKA